MLKLLGPALCSASLRLKPLSRPPWCDSTQRLVDIPSATRPSSALLGSSLLASAVSVRSNFLHRYLSGGGRVLAAHIWRSRSLVVERSLIAPKPRFSVPQRAQLGYAFDSTQKLPSSTNFNPARRFLFYSAQPWSGVDALSPGLPLSVKAAAIFHHPTGGEMNGLPSFAAHCRTDTTWLPPQQQRVLSSSQSHLAAALASSQVLLSSPWHTATRPHTPAAAGALGLTREAPHWGSEVCAGARPKTAGASVVSLVSAQAHSSSQAVKGVGRRRNSTSQHWVQQPALPTGRRETHSHSVDRSFDWSIPSHPQQDFADASAAPGSSSYGNVYERGASSAGHRIERQGQLGWEWQGSSPAHTVGYAFQAEGLQHRSASPPRAGFQQGVSPRP